MTMNRRHFSSSLSALMLGALGLPDAHAQTSAFPSRPVKFIVPFPPGGPVDTTARAVTAKLSETWSQQVLVENRAGAGGIVGAEAAVRAPADGYTVFVCAIHHAVLPGLKPNLSYNIERDFAPVSFGAMFPVILVAHPSVQARTVPELIALAKKQPGKVAYASSGNGGGTHLAGELFAAMAGVDLLHVPYKGSAPAMTDVVGGQVQLMFADAPTALPQIKAGRVRAIAVASPKRSPLAPELPTIAEAGVPGYEAYSWAGFVVPAATPKDVVARLNAEIVRVLSLPEVKQRLLEQGAEAMPGSPEQFGQMMKAEIAKWGRIIREKNIQAD